MHLCTSSAMAGEHPSLGCYLPFLEAALQYLVHRLGEKKKGNEEESCLHPSSI